MITEQEYVEETARMLHLQPKVKRFFILVLLALFALVALLVISGGVSADTHVWDGEDAGALFSTDANWKILGGANDVEPEAGDDVKFWDVDDACTWDVITSINSIVIAANYSGTITQTETVNLGVGGYNQAAGTFTGDGTHYIMDGGDFIRSGGAFTDSTVWLRLTAGGTLAVGATGNAFLGLWFDADTAIQDSVASNKLITVSNGATVTIAASKTLSWCQAFGGYSFSNLGVIDGAGTLKFHLWGDVSYSVTLGVVDCSFWLFSDSGSTTVCSLGASVVVGGSVTVSSDDAVKTATLNLNGHQLNCTTLTASTRGIISSSVAGAQIHATGAVTVLANGVLNATNIAYIDCGGNFDPSAGTWVPGLHQVNITSSYKAVKLAAAQTLYDLRLSQNTNVTGAANVTHNLFYSGLAASLHYHWYYGNTLIANYTSTAGGIVNIGARVLAVQNLYHLHAYPFITTVPGASVAEDSAYLYDANADMAGTWSIVTNASWASFVAGTGVLSGTPDNGDVAIYSVSIRITAANGTEYLNYSLTVTNIAPVFQSTAPATGSYGFAFNYQLDAQDERR